MIDQLKQRLRDHVALADKATEGPWREGTFNVWQDDLVIPIVELRHRKGCEALNPESAQSDCAFIASARTESPANARALLVAINEIENAPHKAACWSYYGRPCDCWKANAIARIEEVMS